MKKWIAFALMLFSIIVLSGCNRGPVLYLLNWGEYINEDLVASFEEEYGVRVEIEKVDSNEAMYSKIKAKTTQFDVAVPSDYMIHKLYKEDLLVELDFDQLPNYSETMFDPLLDTLRDEYFDGNKDVSVPYFWGTLGIMVNTNKTGLETLVEENGWRVFFDAELTGDAKIGMYNSSRDAVAVAQMHLGYDINSTEESVFTEVENLLKAQNYFAWGTDDLKEMVANGNCDIALVYSGDFFDMLYASMEDELPITYNMVVPDLNNIWFDAMVIPTTSTNQTLAHQFINFMIDAENAYTNATEVGYCPPITAAYEAILADPDFEEVVTDYPYYPGLVTQGTVYEDLGTEIYRQLEILLINAKS